MPFHSTETVVEAWELIGEFCHLTYFRMADGSRKGEFAVTRTWSETDIMGAVQSAAEQFNLRPKE